MAAALLRQYMTLVRRQGAPRVHRSIRTWRATAGAFQMGATQILGTVETLVFFNPRLNVIYKIDIYRKRMGAKDVLFRVEMKSTGRNFAT